MTYQDLFIGIPKQFEPCYCGSGRYVIGDLRDLDEYYAKTKQVPLKVIPFANRDGPIRRTLGERLEEMLAVLMAAIKR